MNSMTYAQIICRLIVDVDEKTSLSADVRFALKIRFLSIYDF